VASKPQHLWNESFALRIPAIDAQHKNLFDMIYELECAFESGKEEGAAARILEKLKEYCQFHFTAEERLMQECGYPGLHGHLIQHDDFTRTVLEFESERQAGASQIPLQIAVFLKQWLANHIAVEDRKIVPFVRQQAPEQNAGVRGVPVLIEAESTGGQADTAVCARVSDLLTKQGVLRVGLAHSLEQARSALKDLQSSGQAPAIFVVNTFGAKDILGELDTLMGDWPVLYLRRALYSGLSGLLDQIRPSESAVATVMQAKMRPRLTSMWFYGTRNSGMIAQRAAEAIAAFINTGDFEHIERARPNNW
jgi:hemerythrin